MGELSIRPDYSAMTTEHLARLAHNKATGPYSADQEVALILSETLKRVMVLETAGAPKSRQDLLIERQRREIAAENAADETVLS